MTTILDWRAKHDGVTKVSLVAGRPLVRKPADIDCVVIHQTACVYSSTVHAVLAARALKIGAHATAFRCGLGVLAIPLLWRGIHANALNQPSLGLEIEGRYAGIEGDPRTAWKGIADALDERTIETARATLTALVEAAAAEGIVLRYIRAHRQSSGTRRSDPGEGLWRAVALEHGVARLGLRVEPDRTWPSAASGPGRPIPEAWGGRAGVRY